MADIKQAAKWMQEGKTVRRRAYSEINTSPAGTYLAKAIRLRDDGVIVADGVPCTFGVNGWLADDWEIAE